MYPGLSCENEDMLPSRQPDAQVPVIIIYFNKEKQYSNAKCNNNAKLNPCYILHYYISRRDQRKM